MDWRILTMDWPIFAILAGLCFLIFLLAVYVIRSSGLFPKTPNEAPPVNTPGLAPSGLGFIFVGLMVVCMIGFSFWTLKEMELEGRTAMRVLGAVPVIVGLVFAALYFALKSRGVRFWKDPK